MHSLGFFGQEKSNFQKKINKFCRSLDIFFNYLKNKFSGKYLEIWIFPGRKNTQNMHFSKYLDQKLKKIYFENFNQFFRPKIVYHGDDISFDKKMDFSWHIEILGHFLISVTLDKFSFFFENIFLYDKNGHTYQFSCKNLKN